MRLARRIAATIRQSGPISLSHFMAEAIGAYYASRDPLGAEGDFTTAPEISQMFGELLGLWAADSWHRMGRPEPCALIELGPGRGSLMDDMLRAARAMPEFAAAIQVHLVETSPVLRERQRAKLGHRPEPIAWAESFDRLPETPFILVANEFLDALPIRQFQKTAAGWNERLVAIDEAEGFRFVLSPEPSAIDGLLGEAHRRAGPGSLVEINLPARALAAEIAARALRQPGVALFIDYGAPAHGLGDTLQALKRHAFAPPLEEPGEVDLTAHVDFAALRDQALSVGAQVFGPIPQGVFLERLGIGARASRLMAQASEAQARDIDLARRRLTNEQAMGSLFQCLCIASPSLAEIAPFDRNPQ